MHIVITGASSGIGAAIARELAKPADAKLTLVARRAPLLQELSTRLARPTHLEVRDLSEQPLPVDWLQAARDALGPIDALVNNAGVQVIGKTETIDCDRGESSLFVNLFSPLRLTRAVLPEMLARGSGQIVNVASIASFAPTPGMTYYNASKAGLAGASEALRGELRGSGVDVLTVYPGIIADTDMSDQGFDSYGESRLLRLQPHGDSETLARHIRRAMEQKKARIDYPRFNHLARTLPYMTRWLIDRFTPEIKG